MHPLLNSSVRMDWETPDCVLERVRSVAPITLDPCTTDENPTDAITSFSPGSHVPSLDARWRNYVAHGLVYVNPPYGRALPIWMAKCREQAALGTQIIALVPSRTDTRWWGECYDDCAAVALWRGRLTFRGAPSPAPFPSCLFYWGERSWAFGRAFRDVARVVIKQGV